MLARDIEQLNSERKDIVAEITKEAVEMVETLYPLPKITCLSSEKKDGIQG